MLRCQLSHLSRSLFFQFLCCTSLLMLGICTSSAYAAAHTLNATDQGWYNNTGSHNTGNTNTITGGFGGASEYRAWFKFLIPAECEDGVVSAALTITSVYGSRGSGTVPHSMSVNDVLPANVNAVGVSTNSVPIFNDLGNGSVGAFTIAGSGNFTESITLSAAANTALENAAASATRNYALGIQHLALAPPQYVMGYSQAAVVSGVLNINCSEMGSITLNKTVQNNHGGTAAATDFTAFIDGVATTWSTTSNFAPGTYTISESGLTGYSAGSWTGDCAANGQLTLGAGQDAVCNIVNSDLGVDLQITKSVNNTSPNIGDVVMFTLDVRNNGPDTATNSTVTDALPAGLIYQIASISGGDASNDSDPAGSGLSWVINSLGAGSSTALTFSATIQAP